MKLRLIHYRSELFLAALAGVSLGIFLLASRLTYRLGFPLDDAWIHQTYARNLAVSGEWAYIPGAPSAGSTAPLWSALLAIGYWLGVNLYAWTYWLGWLSLLAVGIAGMRLASAWGVSSAAGRVGVGCFLLLEWRLVWAAGSGMETLLMATMGLGLLAYLASGGRNWLGVGLVLGAAVWVRPDALSLLLPALVALGMAYVSWGERLRGLAHLLLGLTLLLAPYLFFNFLLSGKILPNTFFAKQAEYAILRQLPLWRRLVSQASIFGVGAGSLLVPGFILFLIQALRRRAWVWLAAVAWLMGYILLYALRLPVTYQHGRYLMPVLPVFFTLGLLGMLGWWRDGAVQTWRRVIQRAWLLSTALLLVAFWFLGLRAYALDVAVIETEMVDTALWVNQNTPLGKLVAAHDIGALGYFGDRPLLDLAGLVSPDVIPFIRDEKALAAYLDLRGAEYLVTFPGWYPQLTGQAKLIYQSTASFSPEMGGENMAVYTWNREE